MGYDPKIYEAVRLEFAGKAKRAEAAADARAKTLYERLPALEALDRRLAGVGPRIWEETRKGKEGLSERLAALKKESDGLRGRGKSSSGKRAFPRIPPKHGMNAPFVRTRALYHCPRILFPRGCAPVCGRRSAARR